MMNARLCRSCPLLLVSCVLMLSAMSVQAEVFPCTEADFRLALTQAGGPHTFTCAGPTTLILSDRTIALDVDVVIDGGSLLTIEAPPLGGVSFGVLTLGGTSAGIGNFDSADVEFRNLAFSGWTLDQSDVGESTLILDRVVYEVTVILSAAILQSCNVPLSMPHLTIRNSEFFRTGAVTMGFSGLSLCSADISNTTLRDFSLTAGEPGFAGATLLRLSRTLPPEGQPEFFSVNIENSTIAGNRTSGSLIFADRSANARFQNVTFSDNVLTTTGLPSQVAVLPCIFDEVTNEENCEPVNLSFTNTILDGAGCTRVTRGSPSGVSTPGPLVDEIQSLGGNLEGGSDSCLFDESTDQVSLSSSAIGLLPLGDYGGETPTRALLPGIGTAAIDAGVLTGCPAFDQRGFSRPEPNGTECDAGAVEYVPEPGVGLGLLIGFGAFGAVVRRAVV